MYRSVEQIDDKSPWWPKALVACTLVAGFCAFQSLRQDSTNAHFARLAPAGARVVPFARTAPNAGRSAQNSHLAASLPDSVAGPFLELNSQVAQGAAQHHPVTAILAPALIALGGLALLFFRNQPRPQLAGAENNTLIPVELAPTFFRMAEDASATGTMAPSGGSGGSPKEAPKKEIDLDNLNPSELETMYIDALWAYYTEGKAILTDDQFSRLKMELNWQGSGFPTLHREEIEFVKAVLAFAKGEPILTNEEYDQLKQRIQASGKRQAVTAYLVAVKGKQLLAPEKFEQLRQKMKEAGVKAGPDAIGGTLSDTPNTLQYQVMEVLTMYSALGLVPTALCASAWGFLGFILGGLQGIETVATLGFPVVGATSFLLTRQMIRYLDLTGPKIVRGVCPCCETPIEASFFDVTPSQKTEKCSNCGTICNLDAEKMLIKDAAGFSFVGEEGEDKQTVDQYLSWASGVTSGVLVGKNPISQLGGRKGDKEAANAEKPTDVGGVIASEISAGIFAWAVLLGYAIFGETFVSRARGKGIAIHSGTINDFCKRFNIPNGLRQKYIQTAKRNGHDLGFLVEGYNQFGDGLFGKQAMAWWKSQGW